MCGDHCALADTTEFLADHVVCVVDASRDFCTTDSGSGSGDKWGHDGPDSPIAGSP